MFDVKEYALGILQSPAERTGGREIQADCPSPECGRSGKFYVNTKTGNHICHVCALSGKGKISFVMHAEGVNRFQAEVIVARHDLGPRITDEAFSLVDRVAALREHAIEEDEEPPKHVPMPDLAIPLMPKQLSWLLDHYGISEATAERWGLRYCRMGWFAKRVLIPMESPGGIAFAARSVMEDSDDKYLYPKDSGKSDILIGWHVLRWRRESVVICEGPFDAMKLWQHGYAALALGGKVLHDGQVDQLHLVAERIPGAVVMLDPEELQMPMTIAEKLVSVFDDVRLAFLPAGVDPGDSTKKQVKAALRQAKLPDAARHHLWRTRVQAARFAG